MKRTNFSQQQILEIFNRLIFFKTFNPIERLAIINSHADFFCYDEKEYIIREGSEGDDFYILLNGKISILKGVDEIPIDLNSGDFFGEISFLTGAPRTTNIIARTKTFVIRINQKIMQELESTIREKFKDKFISILVERLDAMNEEWVRLSY
jgi:CRP/FNR family transcriptional regulator, cyclic AMP receptor protein